MNQWVEVILDREIAIIAIKNPPVNALNPGVAEGILQAVERIEKDDSVRAAVVMGTGSTFIAGADIREFGKITSGKAQPLSLNPLLERIEDCRKPIVMAIHGTAFGGGLELAMAGHYRVAVPTALVGQPEVKLGLIPGAGGTQRLPRLAGVAKAVEMCMGGNPVKAGEALEAGILDRLLEGDLRTGAVAFAREIAETPPLKTRQRNHKLGTAEANAPIFEAARSAARAKQRGLLAPQAAIDAVEAATRLPFEPGLEVERKRFSDCLFSDQSKALIHIFFGEREVSKIPDIPKDTPLIPVSRAAVVGAGTMGGGITMALVNAGIPVLLKEVDQAALDRGLATIRERYASSVKRGRVTPQFVEQRLKLIQPMVGFDGFSDVDIVIEAVFEGMALKKEVFRELDRVAKPGAILASNTSTLDIDQIASATSRPEAVIGTHFFSPAQVMRLLEVVRGKATSQQVIATCMQLAKRLGKIGVLVGNCRGFVGNRMVEPYMREAMFLVEEGASVQSVDRALYDFGMAMGPLATGDLAGLDVGWRIRQEYRHLAPPGVRQPLVADRLHEMGRHGQKTGAGWYRYDQPSFQPVQDAEISERIRRWSTEAGIPQRQISAQEMTERCIYALINEGARILEEGFALRPVDIDIIYVNGYGFPAHLGGPMWYADTVGLDKVYERVCDFHRQHGELWKPAPLLAKLAKEGKTFAQLAVEQGVAA